LCLYGLNQPETFYPDFWINKDSGQSLFCVDAGLYFIITFQITQSTIRCHCQS